jgi:hypothetical protein
VKWGVARISLATCWFSASPGYRAPVIRATLAQPPKSRYQVTPSVPAALHQHFRIVQRLHQWLFGINGFLDYRELEGVQAGCSEA